LGGGKDGSAIGVKGNSLVFYRIVINRKWILCRKLYDLLQIMKEEKLFLGCYNRENGAYYIFVKLAPVYDIECWSISSFLSI